MRKLFIGCGIVAGIAVVVMIVTGVVVSSWVKGRMPDADRIEKLQAEMRERFGEPDRFVPPLDGALPADRLATFVAVRESLAVRRGPAAARLGQFVVRSRRDRSVKRGPIAKISHAVDMAQGGTEMVGGVLDYFCAREQWLLDAGMGEGEYIYYYCLTTFSWLRWDALAQGEVEKELRDLGMHGDIDELRDSLLRIFERQLRNLRRDLEAKATRTPAEQASLERVTVELDAGRRVPFAGAFPPDWAAALAPYRARLEPALPAETAAVLLDLIQAEGEGFRFGWGGHRSRRGGER